jgi:hypothetical protein
VRVTFPPSLLAQLYFMYRADADALSHHVYIACIRCPCGPACRRPAWPCGLGNQRERVSTKRQSAEAQATSWMPIR